MLCTVPVYSGRDCCIAEENDNNDGWEANKRVTNSRDWNIRRGQSVEANEDDELIDYTNVLLMQYSKSCALSFSYFQNLGLNDVSVRGFIFFPLCDFLQSYFKLRIKRDVLNKIQRLHWNL